MQSKYNRTIKKKGFITFIAIIIINEIFQKAEKIQKRNLKYHPVPGMISELENVECTRNFEEKYRRKYALAVKQKTILKEFEMDEKYTDRSISGFNY